MTNKISIFNNEQFGQIRTVEQNGVAWFIAKDIALALGHTNPSRAIRNFVATTDKGVTEVTTPSGKQNTTIINESGLYDLIFESKLKTAKEFRHWVTSEVLPTIRKTGGYISNEDTFISTYLPNADEQTKIMIRSNLETIRSLNSKIEQDKPKVLFANAVETSQTSILVGDLAKLIQQNGVPMGQKRLFNWMREEGFLIKGGNSKNMPTQKAMDKGLFEVKERTISNPDGSVRITKTPKVTGKGQIYFIKKLTEVAV